MRPLKSRILDVTANRPVPLVAGVFIHLILVVQLPRERGGPRTYDYLRILHLDFVIDCVVGGTREAFGDPQVYRGRVERWRTGNTGIGHVGLPIKVRGLDDQRIALPVAARFSQPLFDGWIERRTSVGWNDADFVGHFEHDENVARSLHDPDAVVVVARQHGNRHAARDAPVPFVEIVGGIEYGLAKL